MKKKIIFVRHFKEGIFAFLLVLPIVAHAQFTFTTNIDGSLNIAQYTGSGGAVIVPDTTNSLPITTIGNNSFIYSLITSVTFGTNLTTIAGGAFSDCENLTNVMISESVTNIALNEFVNCVTLTAINVAPNNPAYSSIDGVLLDRSQRTVIEYPQGSTGSYVIPNSVTSIGQYAFRYCSGLTNVTIPGSVTNLEADAFQGCSGLTNVAIPQSVISVWANPFENCLNLTEINVDPNNSAFTSVGGIVFDKSKVTLLQFPCGLAGSYSIPTSVTTIGENAFEECKLAVLMIPDAVTSIGDYAFEGYHGLTSLTIPDSVTNIGDWAFFQSDFTNVTIGGGVSSIGLALFYQANLHHVTIGTNVCNIEEAGFEDCEYLASVIIPNSVTNIGYVAFAGCYSLTNAIIGNKVSTIGDQAFVDCPLKSITFPNSLTNFGEEVFYNCGSLKDIYFLGNAPSPTNDSSVFANDATNITAYYLAGATGWGPTFDGIPTSELFNAGVTRLTLFVSSTNVTASFSGVPTFQYTLERSTNLTQILGWIPISTNTAPEGGLIQVVDDFLGLGNVTPPLPSSAFYRVRYGPQD